MPTAIDEAVRSAVAKLRRPQGDDLANRLAEKYLPLERPPESNVMIDGGGGVGGDVLSGGGRVGVTMPMKSGASMGFGIGGGGAIGKRVREFSPGLDIFFRKEY